MLLGRGHPGDGAIDLKSISARVLAAAGQDGFAEVEIFSQRVRDAPPGELAATGQERLARVLGPVPWPGAGTG